MPVRYALVTELVQSGTVEFSSPGFGTPVAALFISAGASTLSETKTDDVVFSIGFTDGTRQNTSSCVAEDGQVSRDSYKRSTDDELLMFLDPTLSGIVDGEANFNAWVTDGIEITFGAALSAAAYVTCLLVGGEDTEAYTAYADNGPGGLNITAPGFTPTTVFTHSALHNTDDKAQSTDAAIGFGVASWDGTTVEQFCQMWSQLNRGSAGPGTDVQHRLDTSYAIRDIDSTGTYGGWDLSAFDADGFTIGQVGGAGTGGYYLAIRSSTPDDDMAGEQTLTDATAPAALGSATVTTTEETDLVVMMAGLNPSLDTTKTDSGACCFSLGFAVRDPYTNEFDQVCHSFASEDNVGTSDCGRMTDQLATIKVLNVDGTQTGAETMVKVIEGPPLELKYDYLTGSASDSKVLIYTSSAYKQWSYMGYLTLTEIYDSTREIGIGHIFDFKHKNRSTGTVTAVKVSSESLTTALSGTIRQLTRTESGTVIGDQDGSDTVVSDPLSVYVSPAGDAIRIIDRSNREVVFKEDIT